MTASLAVLSHLVLTFIDDGRQIRAQLALYDWTESEMNRRREAIVDVRSA